jgi:hypothetical protein
MGDKIIFLQTKRAQMKLSFGMIFSIILIIIFISFAFYAILKFLDLQDTIKIAQFKDNLQNDIDKMWKGNQGEREVNYVLPAKIKSVCFKEDEYENLVFRADKFIEGGQIEHINITKITEEGEFCIENSDNKIKMIIKKDYGEALVTIEKNE